MAFLSTGESAPSNGSHLFYWEGESFGTFSKKNSKAEVNMFT